MKIILTLCLVRLPGLRFRYCSVTVAEPEEASLQQLFWLPYGLCPSRSLFLRRYRMAQGVTGKEEPEASMLEPKQTAPNFGVGR